MCLSFGSSKNVAPEPIICLRDLRIGTDGVFQTSLEIKKITVVEKKHDQEEGCSGEKNAEACEHQCGGRERTKWRF